MSAIFEGACALRSCSAASLLHNAAHRAAADTPLARLARAAGYEKELVDLSSAITRKAALIPTLTRGAPPFKVLRAAPRLTRPFRGACAEERKAKVVEAENDVAEAEALVRRGPGTGHWA